MLKHYYWVILGNTIILLVRCCYYLRVGIFCRQKITVTELCIIRSYVKLTFAVKSWWLLLVTPAREPSCDLCSVFPELGQRWLDHCYKHFCSVVKFQEFLWSFFGNFKLFCMSLLLLFCTISSNAKRARENITVLMICCALHKNTCKYILNALNIFLFKNCHPPSSYLDMFLYELEKRLCFFLAAQWIFSSNLFMRSSKLSCRRLLKCDRSSSTDQSEAWPFFGGHLWWSNGSLLSLSYSYFVIKEGVKYFFFLYFCIYRGVWACIPGEFFSYVVVLHWKILLRAQTVQFWQILEWFFFW